MADETLGEVFIDVFLKGSELFMRHSIQGAKWGFSAARFEGNPVVIGALRGEFFGIFFSKKR